MIRIRDRSADKEHQRWLKRQAVHVVAQLPENEQDALAVLSHARELVIQFIGQDATAREHRVLKLVEDDDC